MQRAFEHNNDPTLRPTSWEEYIGQDLIKENIRILLSAAEGRSEAAEHLLFYGPPGLGKTTLAHLIANQTGRKLRATSGPAIERVSDLASILTNLEPGEILFIDEIHRLNKAIEEILYPAMERGVLDIVLGKGPSARTVQLDLPPFTLVAATTRLALLSSPLRSRFGGGVFRLNFYSDDELSSIVARSAERLGINPTDDAVSMIARRSRATPRTANSFLKRVRDYSEVHQMPFDEKTVEKALALVGIDTAGLGPTDRAILEAIEHKFNGGPVGIKTLAAATGEEEQTIEEVIEPYLIQMGYLEKTPRGRIITDKGRNHIKGFELPK
jgi:holliday junction DNA helicase RuvB